MDIKFTDTDSILNYRPTLEWEEPEDIDEDAIPEIGQTEQQLAREKTEQLIAGYTELAKIADLIQKKIDDRVKILGGFSAQLDPKVDAATIAAMKRRFPEVDSGTLTYDIYKKALACIKENQKELPLVKSDEIKNSQLNPSLTNFGGFGSAPGKLRPEISNPIVDPVDLAKYQEDAVEELFDKMEDMISNNSASAVLTHELNKHKS